MDVPPPPVAHVARAHAQRPHVFVASSTAYTPCSSGTVMANGQRVAWGYVASNRHPLGTWIRLTRPVNGLRDFIVGDRIGSGSELDIFMPSCRDGINYGRRIVRYVVVRRR